MKIITQFVTRQIGWLIFFLLLFASLNGIEVSEGLWQVSGLHGYTIQPGARGGPPRIISTWASFVEMLAFFGLACAMFALKLCLNRENRHKGIASCRAASRRERREHLQRLRKKPFEN